MSELIDNDAQRRKELGSLPGLPRGHVEGDGVVRTYSRGRDAAAALEG